MTMAKTMGAISKGKGKREKEEERLRANYDVVLLGEG